MGGKVTPEAVRILRACWEDRGVEAWSTPEEIVAARDRFERALRWRRPVAHAIGWVARPDQVGAKSAGGSGDVAGAAGGSGDVAGAASDGAVRFTRVNVGEHYLPGAILATVLDHRAGSRAYRVSQEQLERAIALLAPVEACGAFQHPNLVTWREMLARAPFAEDVLVVFADDLDAAGDDPYVRCLLESARQVTPDGND
jgi:hypothetical protein